MSTTGAATIKKKWYQKMPDPMVLIFFILLLSAALTYVIPAGEYTRQTVNGYTHVIPGSFHTLESHPTKPFDVFVAIPRGMLNAAQYLFIVFIAGGLFHLLTKTGALENTVGTLVKTIGVKRRGLIIWLTTMIYGFFGVAVGFENNIALIPIAMLVGHAVGGGSLLGVGMAVGGIGVGFALSPINPYTVAVAQKIANLPLYSGWLPRTILLLVSLHFLVWYLIRHVARSQSSHADQEQDEDLNLSKPIENYSLGFNDWKVLLIFLAGMAFMLYGVFTQGWYINQIAGVFLAIAIFVGLACRMSGNQIVQYMMEGASSVTSGALIIGLAVSIKVVLEDAKVVDTIIHGLSSTLHGIPNTVAGVMMSVVQGIINFFIPGGSGQALVTMPIMVPLGDMLDVPRQVTVSAFQVGDGLTNLIVPTSGGTLAMLALGKVSFEDWLKFIFPLMLWLYLIAWLFIVAMTFLGWH